MTTTTPTPNLHTSTTTHAQSSHTYTAHFHPDWCIGSVPHGGYVTSTLQRAIALHFSTTLSVQNQPHVLALHLSFLRRTSTAPALITIEDAKLGRQTSTVHVSLSQKDGRGRQREEVVGYVTHTNLSTAMGPTFQTPWALTPAPKPKPKDWAAVARGEDANWALRDLLPFSEFRKASRRVRWVLPPGGQEAGVQDQWMALDTRQGGGKAGYERWTNDSLGFVVDMFPQLVETFLIPGVYGGNGSGGEKDARAKFWYPTVVLNLDVKKVLPEEGVEWLFLRVLTKEIKDGRYDLDVVVLDELGELVALSNHVCFAVSASRNLKERDSHTSIEKGKL